MTDESPIPFTWADVWLLQSILAFAGRGTATLKDVVAAGDAINHAIFTFAEMDGGVARLTAAGLVTFDGCHLLPAESAIQLQEGFKRKKYGMQRQTDALKKHLGVKPSGKSDPHTQDPAWTTAELTPESFSEACSEYHREFRQSLRKSKKRKK